MNHPTAGFGRFADAPLRLGVGAIVVAAILFAFIAAQISSNHSLVSTDASLAIWLHTHGTPALTKLFLPISLMHGIAPILTYAAIFAILLARARMWHWVLAVVLTVPAGLCVNSGLKYVFERARPVFDDPLVTLQTYSFPSGHVAGTVLFYGVLAAFLISRYASLRARVACISALVIMIVMVALSRIYLGAHYLSDVIAAICSSCAWLGMSLLIAQALARRAAA